MDKKSISPEKLQELIDGVPDIGEPEETCISYWQKANDKMVYLEGWADACLAGTGFPLMEEGETARKVAYIEDLTPEILQRKAKEKGLKLLEGGFKETPDAENLYGVTYGIYEKAEGGNPMTKEATNDTAVTDEEFASQVAKYVASIPISTFVRMKPGAITEDILAMAREKGYEDGPRFVRYFKTPEGQAAYIERYRLELKTRRPIPELALTQAEKSWAISEFKQIMEREPTPAEMYELYAEELKLKRKGVPV